MAWPINSTMGGVRVRPTMPRMSYALKISGGSFTLGMSIRVFPPWRWRGFPALSSGASCHGIRNRAFPSETRHEAEHPRREPGERSRKAAVHEADVSTAVRLLQGDRRRHLSGAG